MQIIKNPQTISTHYGIPIKTLSKVGILDSTLTFDTKLFIDPTLIKYSKHKEIRVDAYKLINQHFGIVIKLLKSSRNIDDRQWQAAKKLLDYKEIKATCLGYGSNSIHGGGMGPHLIEQSLKTFKEIIDLGVEDAELFILLPLIEEKIGPDRISDMITFIILPALIKFTQRVSKKLKIKSEMLQIKNYNEMLPLNPFEKTKTPIIMLPIDILRSLPVVESWEDIADAARRNDELRKKVGMMIGQIWKKKELKNKEKLRRQTLKSKEAIEYMLTLIRGVKPTSYDQIDDPEGLNAWKELYKDIGTKYPLSIGKPTNLSPETIIDIVKQIVGQFKFLIEKKGIWKALWHKGKPHKEKVAQMLFFVAAYSYCKCNNLDITPESDTGSGIVDFKFSYGGDAKVLVETKLSTNKKLVSGYNDQLKAYKESENPIKSFYLVVDVGKMKDKLKKLYESKNKIGSLGDSNSEIIVVDGKRKLSASRI